MVDAHCERDESGDEVEITPEMVDAGYVEYASRWCDLRDADKCAAREMLAAAFRAMYLRRH